MRSGTYQIPQKSIVLLYCALYMDFLYTFSQLPLHAQYLVLCTPCHTSRCQLLMNTEPWTYILSLPLHWDALGHVSLLCLKWSTKGVLSGFAFCNLNISNNFSMCSPWDNVKLWFFVSLVILIPNICFALLNPWSQMI